MLEARSLTKIYRPKKGESVTALNSVNVSFAEKGLVFLLGKSGSGKSTLLNLLGGLDSISSGEIIIKGKSSAKFSQSDFDSYRNTFIGFIFQEFNILEDYSVGRNIGLSLELQHRKADETVINSLLNQVDLEGYANRKPNELSGGQKQRVAIARALIKNPEIIMADEPTGALDSKTGKQVFDTLKKLSQEKLVIVVSHDRENAEIYGDRIIELADGNIINDRIRVGDGQFVEQPINYVSDSLIRIKAGNELTNEDVTRINAMLKKSNTDTYISLDEKANIEFAKKSAISTGVGFVATTQENNPVKSYDAKNFKLVKSRLPFKDSFRMGASGLKLKKVRLAFTIILSVIAFTLFGFVNTVSAFDAYMTEIQTMRDAGQKILVVQAQSGYYSAFGGASYGSWDTSAKFTSEHLDELERLSGSPLLRVVESDSNYSNNGISLSNQLKDAMNPQFAYYSYASQISGFVEIPEYVDGNFKELLAGKKPEEFTTYDTVGISDYAADVFIKYGIKESGATDGVSVTNYSGLIGKKVIGSFDGRSFNLTIGGVYKTDFDTADYEMYKTMSITSLSSMQRMSLEGLPQLFVLKAYTKQGFSSEMKNFPQISGNPGQEEQDPTWFYNDIKFDDKDVFVERGFNRTFNATNTRLNSNLIYWGNGVSKPASLNDNDIIISYEILNDPDGYGWWGDIPDGEGGFYYGINKQKIKNRFDELKSQNKLLQSVFSENDGRNTYSGDWNIKGVTIFDYDERFNATEFEINPGYIEIPEIMMKSAAAQTINNEIMLNLQNGSTQQSSVRINNYTIGNFEYNTLTTKSSGMIELIKFGEHTNLIVQNDYIYWGNGRTASSLAADEVIISATQFDTSEWINNQEVNTTYTTQQKKDMYDQMISSGKLKAQIGKIEQNWNDALSKSEYSVIKGRNVKIAGIYFSSQVGSYSSPVIVSEELYSAYESLLNMPRTVIIKLTGDTAKDREIAKFLKNSEEIESRTAFRLGTLTTLTPILELASQITGVMRTVFFYLSIAFSIFAGLMLMNFIGVSVSAKKKDIGVLRAIGARSRDVFSIFLNEGLIIGLINVALSITALIILSIVLNGLLGVSLLIPGALQFLLMAALCFGVVVISTFLPVRKIANKKPIDAINNR